MRQIFKNILETIEPIDLREKVGHKAELKDEQLKDSHYLISIVEEMVEKAQNLGLDLCTRNGFIYLFNSQYWEQVHELEMKIFLREVSLKMAIDRYKAIHYAFNDVLLKQFYASLGKLVYDADQHIKINLQNGTFLFGDKRELRDFNKEDFLTYLLEFPYDEAATAPMFETYLNKVLPDISCQNILAEYLGYVFTKGHKQQKCLLLYGSGSNGKSVFFDIVKALIGSKNLSTWSLRNLGDENCRALISNKLLNYSSEMDAQINKETFKQLVSGEPLQARLKYKDSFTIENYAKLMFNCNELPKDVEFNNAYFRRFIIVPFTETIPEAEQDKDLANKIIAKELSGIFNWILTGLVRLINQGKFSESEIADNALKEFQQDADSVYQFLNAYNYKKNDAAKTRFMQLYHEYQEFCKNNGYRSLNTGNFRRRLEALNIYIKRVQNGNIVGLDAPERPVIMNKEEVEDVEDEKLPF